MFTFTFSWATDISAEFLEENLNFFYFFKKKNTNGNVKCNQIQSNHMFVILLYWNFISRLDGPYSPNPLYLMPIFFYLKK